MPSHHYRIPKVFVTIVFDWSTNLNKIILDVLYMCKEKFLYLRKFKDQKKYWVRKLQIRKSHKYIESEIANPQIAIFEEGSQM